MKRHPLSAAFPSMSQTDLDALILDIEQFGQRESGLLLDGMILDGWHRYQATAALGIEFNALDFESEYPGTDPVAFVLSKNLHRRHLTASQRAMAAVACSQWTPAGNPNLAPGARLGKTIDEIAKEADVSPRTVSQAKVVHEAGLGGAVISGEMSLKAAEATIKAQRAPSCDRQEKPAAHEPAAEPAASNDAIANKPNSHAHAAEESSQRSSGALDALIAERDAARNDAADLADELQLANAELNAYRAGELGDGEKALVAANKRALQLEGEIRRLEGRRDALMNENAELKREVKRLLRRLGLKANG